MAVVLPRGLWEGEGRDCVSIADGSLESCLSAGVQISFSQADKSYFIP